MRMREAAKNANVAEPKFELENFFRVTFRRTSLQPDKFSDERLITRENDSIINNGGINGGNGGINGGYRKATIDLFIKDPTITTVNISKHINISIRTVERIVAELKKDGIVERVGSKRSGYWEIKNKNYKPYS